MATVNYLNSVPKLMGRENYSDWAFAVENVFVLEGLSKCIDGSETDVTVVAKAKAKLILTLDPTLFIHVKDTNSAKEVWDRLKKLYEDSGFARKIGLLRKLISLRLESCNSMEEYVNQVIDTSQKLERCGFKLTQELIGSLMLAGLTEKFEPMVIAIEHSGINVTADSIKSKLLDMYLGGAENSSCNSGSAFANKAYSKTQRDGSTKKVNKDKNVVTCYKCKKTGHYMNRCPELRKNKSDSSNAFNAVFLTGRFDKSDWYIDSGCSVHLTSRKDWLKNVHNDIQMREITVANDNKLAIECAGDIDIQTIVKNTKHSVTVHKVLYIPGLMTNLLSVSQLIKNNNNVIFNKNGCEVYNSSHQLIATASLVDNVYKLNFVKTPINLLAGLSVSGETWHRRFGHLNYSSLSSMKNGLVEGMDCRDSLVKSNYDLCEVCCQGKQTRLSFNHKGNRAKHVLELIHGDLCGPMEVTSLGGSRYFMILEDDFTRMSFAYFLKSKAEAHERFKEFKNYVENQKGTKIKCFRSDQGTEFDSKHFRELYEKNGILHQQTNAYTPQQNGMSERMNRTIVEKARCLLYDANMQKLFWAEAVATAVYLRNRTSVSGIEKTPYEMWHNRKPDVSSIRVFGSKAMTLIPKEKRQKWDKKSQKMILVGFSDTIKGYRLYDPVTKGIVTSRDVIIEETKVLSRQTEKELHESADSVGVEVDPPEDPDELLADSVWGESDPPKSPIDSSTELQASDTGIAELRRSQRATKPKQFDDFVTYACIQEVNSNGDPSTVEEAMLRPDADLWKKAMSEEIHSFKENDVWELSDRPSDSSTVVPCKWVFKQKTSEHGEVKYRARLVAKGYVQKQGIDYDDVFSPVIRHSNLRLLIALAAKLDLKITHLDVKTAFLNSPLDQPVYMQQPEGFKIKHHETKVYKLKKAVYGLKQSSRAWNAKVNEVLSDIGFKRSKYESCLFIKKDNTSLTFIALYVDDFFVFSNDNVSLKALKSKLHTEFDIKDLGEAKQCLGVRLTRDYKNTVISLDQENYIDQILKNFSMENCKPVNTPLESKLNVESVSNSNINSVNVPYQQLIGSLMYLSVLTRPDITFAVNYLSQFNNCYSDYHWRCAKRILRYLKGTKQYKLKFFKDSGIIDLEGFVDADWANDQDRKSYTGYIFKLSNCPISWQSCKQKTTALSSTEAEYIGLSEATKEAIYLKNILEELVEFKNSVSIKNDNQSALKLASNPVFHKRSKHIDVRYHFLRECIANNLITVQYQSSNEMVADIMTKGLAKVKHLYFVNKLSLS